MIIVPVERESHMVSRSAASDVPELVELLALAFDDDPIVNWFVRQDSRRHQAMRHFFDLALRRQTLPHNEVYHYEGLKGVALWAPPNRWSLSWRDQLQLAPAIVAIASWMGIPRALQGLQAMEHAHPTEPHVYLSFLCTHPDHRGEGVGTTLLTDMLRRCDRGALPVYLENTKPENEAFYRHHGFRVTGDIRLGPEAPAYYAAMWRDPC